jgi:hypothetical protein
MEHAMDDVVWLTQMVRDGCTIARVGRSNGHVVVSWPDLATLVVDRQGLDPRFEAVAGAPEPLVEKLRVGTARALVGHLRGELTLHAGAVGDGTGALAFLGDSKAGKSTLAHAMIAHDPRWRFLSDDLLRVDGASALPSEKASWLAVDALAAFGIARSERSTVVVDRVAEAPAPIRAAIHLVWADGPPSSAKITFRRLKGFSALSVLVESMVRVPLDEPELRAADIDRIARLAEHVPVFELARPHALDRLGETVAFLAEQTWS